jgi:O-antigen ligase
VNTLAGAEWWRAERPAEGRLVADASRQTETGSGSTAFRALMAFTFILLLAPQTVVPALQPFRIALVTAVVGIAAHVLDRVSHGRPPAIWCREMALVSGLVAWAAVTLPLSYWPGGSASLLLNSYLKIVALFWLLANVVDSLPRLRTLAWGLTAIALLLALTAVKNFFSGVYLDQGVPVKRILGYEGGLTANPNDLALMLNLLLPFAVALLLASRSALARGVLLFVVLLEAAAVIVTFSRAGFLALAATLLLYLWRLARRGAVGWVLAGLVVGLAGSILLPGGYLTRLGTIADIDADPTGSAQARWSDTETAVRFVATNPLIGAGLGMDTLALNELRGPAWKQVHNVYLEYAVDLGLPGLALFLLLLVSCLKRIRQVRLGTAVGPTGSELSHLAEGIEIALLSFVVAAFFCPVAYHFHFYYLAGLAVAAGQIHRRLGSPEGSRPAEGPAR